jgi:hypothetical protein
LRLPQAAPRKEIDLRQFWNRERHGRLFLLVAVTSVITLAASSPIYSAEGSSHVPGHSPASPLAAADCSEATARQLVEQHRLNDFGLPNPVRQVLCGAFTGSGSEAMAIAISAPTCWGIQRWAVFAYTSGAWRLVLDQRRFIFPLAVVGSDIREHSPVFRAGDPRCLPSGGSHARVWHWNGTRLTAGPWRQVTPGAAVTSAAFRSPSQNIECGMSDNRSGRLVECWTSRPPQKAKLYLGGRVTICRGSQARCRIGNAGEVPTLAYGRQTTVGRFRCSSRRIGIACTVISSGKGFLINRSGVRRIGN